MKNKKQYFFGLLMELTKIKREAAKRKLPYDQLSVLKADVGKYVEEGWEIDKELTRKTRLKRLKTIDERLENRLWILFFRLGYQELNEGRQFQVLIERKGADPIKKQIDVFAKDEETIIVAETKTCDRLKKRSLQKDIEEFANLKGPISSAIKSHYGRDFKPKIIWLFVTENVIWSKPDKERARGEKIRIITERELRYYLQIADHLGKAARFQFLAEFLKNQKIPGLQNKKIPAIRGKLGGNKFYCFVTTPKELLKISFINHRSLNDPDGVPTYQRLVSRSRMRQIETFLTNGGYFPTNLLINFTCKVRFEIIKKDDLADVTYGHLYLPDQYQSAWIIDGQHRLYGFAHLDEKYLQQNIMVLAFEGMRKEDEADLFLTINHEQKTVPKTLLDDLEGELKWGSDIPTERIGSISARLINVLNADIGEPLYGRVTQQGIPATEKTCLTVPALKDGLRRSGLLGKAILKQKVYETGPFSGTSDSETLDRARSGLNQYFSLLRDNNFGQWEKGRGGYLCSNVALQGYLHLLSSLISYMEVNKGVNAHELSPEEIMLEIEEYMEPILKWIEHSNDANMEKMFKVQFGSGGPREYYYRLCKIVKSSFSDFQPEGMEEWEAEQSDEKIETADRKLKELNIMVQSYIFKKFKDI